MKNRTLITSSILAGLALVIVVNSVILPNRIMAANNAPLSACGPRGQLPAEVSANVDANARCFELRMYTVDTDKVGTGEFNGGINELHQRFRDGEVALFEKHGAQIVGVWQDVEKPNTLVYMLAYRDRAHREEVWAGFAADPTWNELRTKYNVPLQRPQVFMLSSTDYSHLE